MPLCLRPLVVRFTDPSIEDAHIDLFYESVDSGAERQWPALAEVTVGELKEQVRRCVAPLTQLAASHEAMRGRRLRLIYLGRLLPNGVRLASWLDALAPEKAEPACEQVTLAKAPRSDGMFVLQRTDAFGSKLRGKRREDEALAGDGPWDMLVARCAPAFLQCSVGAPASNDDDAETPIPSTTPEPRGFDRLRYTAGMSALDVQIMREQFHQRAGFSVARSGDVLTRQEEDDLAYRMEEQWIDTMSDEPLAPAGTLWRRTIADHRGAQRRDGYAPRTHYGLFLPYRA
mgnify:FL=1